LSRGASDRRRGLLVPAVLTLAALIVLVGLGRWQLERKTWKEQLIARLTERFAAPPTALPAPTTWPGRDAEILEFRRVTFPVEFLHEQEALVYATASAFRPDISGPGYWVFTPARLAGGSLLMVNRGWIPADRQDATSRAAGQLSGIVDVTGVLRWPEPRGWFTPADDPGRNLWFVRDPLAIAAAKGVEAPAPFYVEQEAPIPPGGLPRAGRLQVVLPNNHLQYAITWFGLALALAAVFIAWASKRLRRPHGRAEDDLDIST
jgi:surfeit locus 1 family protein